MMLYNKKEWDKDRWITYRKTLEKNIDTISQRLVEKEGEKPGE